MKKHIHPEYRPVVFRDRSTGDTLLTRSTFDPSRLSGQTVTVDGVEYPVIDVDVTSASHPFWTGKSRTLDSEGRVEKFNRRYAKGT